MSEVDLESLAAGYAHRPPTRHALARAAAAWEASGGAAGDVAVDVGGGRGSHAALWAEAGARAVVVDPAVGMAVVAAAHGGVAAIRGRAEALPLRTATAVLVRFHWSLHHTRWREAVGEARRVLRHRGRLEIASPGSHDLAASHMARWFPSVASIDAARFPDLDEVAASLAVAGFSNITRERVAEPIERRAGDWVAAVEAGFVSTLQLLPVGEVADGIARFRLHHPDPEEVVRYELRYECLAGTAAR